MIITNNEELLRVNCSDVSDNEASELVSTLENELNNSNRLGKLGIGLAAPQIGVAKNVAIIRLNNLKINLINPKIEKMYDPKLFRSEGCLSFPGRVEDTTRFQEIVVNNNGERFVATGLLAVVCQHEIDHLNLKLFYDYKIKQNHKLAPNDTCYCGVIDVITGKVKKYKKCCGR